MIDLQIINLKTRKSWSRLLQLKTNNITKIPTVLFRSDFR